MPDLGLAAAEDLGVNLDRLILVPSPDAQWLSVLNTLIDVVGIVALGPLSPPSDRMLSTLSGRLREREATLMVRSHWPRTEARIGVVDRHWEGLGAGHGTLEEHRVRVAVTSRNTREARQCDLIIDHAGVRRVDADATVTPIASRRQAG